MVKVESEENPSQCSSSQERLNAVPPHQPPSSSATTGIRSDTTIHPDLELSTTDSDTESAVSVTSKSE